MSQDTGEQMMPGGDASRVAPRFGEYTFDEVVRRTVAAVQKGEFVTLVGNPQDTGTVLDKIYPEPTRLGSPIRIKLKQTGTTFAKVMQDLRTHFRDHKIFSDWALAEPSRFGDKHDFGEIIKLWGVLSNPSDFPPVVALEGIENLSAQGLADLIDVVNAQRALYIRSGAKPYQQPAIVLTATEEPLNLIIKRSEENPLLNGKQLEIGHEFNVPAAPPPPQT